MSERPALAPGVVELDRAYRKLMSAYADALGEAERAVRRRPTDPPPTVGYRGLFFGQFVRRLVGGHIRKQLEALAARCLQLEAATAGGKRAWLLEVREAAERTSAALPSLRLPSVFVVVPLVLGAVAAVGNFAVDSDRVPAEVWRVATFVLFLLTVVAGFDLSRAFGRKRNIFLPGARKLDRRPRDEQLQHTGPNIYRYEQDLFDLLGTGRPAEPELDAWAKLLGVFVLAEMAAVVLLLAGRDSGSSVVGGLGLGFALFVVNFLNRTWVSKRVWR